ncbi:MAG: hypothetical protein GF411_07575 [Candidatus Lokiarchaeota archaeon]|nr:hypothetical protein [Candidatus Lokiarchaeota archaeon]
MTIRKWRVIDGHVYRLSGKYDDMRQALAKVQSLREESSTAVIETAEGLWLVYWKPRLDIERCSSLYAIHNQSKCNSLD